MGKRKESFFERLLKKNAEQEGKGQAPKKRKSWKIILLSFILAGVAVTGITIPLVINSTKVTYTPALKPSIVIASFNTPNDENEINVTIGDIDNADLATEAKDPKKQLDELNKKTLLYLYEKEYQASKEYQRLWNASLSENEKPDKSIALKSIDEIKKNNENQIKDVRDDFKVKYGYDNWEKQFNDYLLKNYNATTIEEAVENKLFNTISSDAAKRFRLITKDITKLINRKANYDIYNVDKDGKAITSEAPLVKKGEKVFPWYSEGGHYFEVDGKFMSFMTDSYVMNDQYKSADIFIDQYLKNDNPFLVSQFTLPTVAPKNKDSKWDVNREMFKRLMFYWPATENNKAPKQSFEMVKEFFKPFTHYMQLATEETSSNLPKEAISYSTVLSQLSSDDSSIKQNWGTNGIKSIKDVFSSDEQILNFMPLLKDILFKNGVPAVDLFKTLGDIQTSLGVAAPQVDDSKTKEENQTEVAKYNKEIVELFDKSNEATQKGLYADKYKEKVIDPMSKLFIDDDGKYQTFYTINNFDNVMLIPTDKGLQLTYVQTLADIAGASDKEKVENMLKNDFLMDSKYKDVTGVKYGILNKLNKSLANSDYINSTMLEDQDFITFLKTQDNKYALDATGKKVVQNVKYDDPTIENLKTINKAISAGNRESQALNITVAIDKWMKNRAKSNLDSTFYIKNDIAYIKGNDEKSAHELIFEKLKELLKVFNN